MQGKLLPPDTTSWNLRISSLSIQIMTLILVKVSLMKELNYRISKILKNRKQLRNFVIKSLISVRDLSKNPATKEQRHLEEIFPLLLTVKLAWLLNNLKQRALYPKWKIYRSRLMIKNHWDNQCNSIILINSCKIRWKLQEINRRAPSTFRTTVWCSVNIALCLSSIQTTSNRRIRTILREITLILNQSWMNAGVPI